MNMLKMIKTNYDNTNEFDRWVTCRWIVPLLKYCQDEEKAKRIELKDLPDFSDKSDEIDWYVDTFEKAFKYRVAAGSTRPLPMAIYDTFKWEMLAFSIINVIGDFIGLGGLYAYAWILEILNHDRNEVAFTNNIIAILVYKFLQDRFCDSWHRYVGGRRTMYGHRARYVLRQVIFRKILTVQ